MKNNFIYTLKDKYNNLYDVFISIYKSDNILSILQDLINHYKNYNINIVNFYEVDSKKKALYIVRHNIDTYFLNNNIIKMWEVFK